MVIRAVIKFSRKRVGRIDTDVPGMAHSERLILMDILTTKNYKPHQGLVVYGSFNKLFKAYLFSLRSFCHIFALYHRKVECFDVIKN